MANKGLTFTPIAAGEFPDGYANRLQGGIHVVADITARDAIASYRLLQGMLVHVLSDGCVYRLTAVSPLTWQKVVVATTGTGDNGKVLTVASGEPSWQTLNALPSGGASGKFLGYGSSAEWKDGYLPSYALPAIASGDARKLFMVDSTGAAALTPQGADGTFLYVKNESGTLSVAWRPISEVPSSVAADEGKVLRVNASGTPAFAYPLSKRMNILGSTATNDTATYAVVGSIAFDRTLLDVRGAQNISLRYLLETSNASNAAKVRLFNKTASTIVGTEQTTTSTSATSPTTYGVHATLNALASETVLEVQICLTTDASADGSAVATLKAAWIEAV